MDRSPFALKPSLYVMIPLLGIIVAVVGAAAWRHTAALQLAGLGLGALSMAVIAIALRRHAQTPTSGRAAERPIRRLAGWPRA